MEHISLAFLRIQPARDFLAKTCKHSRTRQSRSRRGLRRIHTPLHPRRRSKHPATVQSQRPLTLQARVHWVVLQVEMTLALLLHSVIRQVQGIQPPILLGPTTRTVSIILLRLPHQQHIRPVVSRCSLKRYFFTKFYTVQSIDFIKC